MLEKGNAKEAEHHLAIANWNAAEAKNEIIGSWAVNLRVKIVTPEKRRLFA